MLCSTVVWSGLVWSGLVWSGLVWSEQFGDMRFGGKRRGRMLPGWLHRRAQPPAASLYLLYYHLGYELMGREICMYHISPDGCYCVYRTIGACPGIQS